MIRIALMVLLVAGCSSGNLKDAPLIEPHVIENNQGGQTVAFIADRKRLVAWGGKVMIKGYCNSACGVFVTMPNACIDKDSRLGFHASSTSLGSSMVSPHLRGEIKRRYLEEWQFSEVMIYIPAKEYVVMDPETKICEE